MKKILLVLIVLVATIFLTGCYICIDSICPPYQETHPNVSAQIDFYTLLQLARGWTPWAEYRWMKSNYYDLVSKDDMEWVIKKIQQEYGLYYDCFTIINLVHNTQPGYEKVPFGFVKYWDGTYRNVVVVLVNGEVRAYVLINGNLYRLIEDYTIVEIVI